MWRLVGYISAGAVADIYVLICESPVLRIGEAYPKTMSKQTYWYILYVHANKEQRVINDFKQAFYKRELPYFIEPFCPESEYYYRNKKERNFGRVYRKRPLFSGYVFLETDMPQEEFLQEFADYIYKSEDIIRLLKYGNTNIIALAEDEKTKFEYLFKGKRCLGHSVGFIEGDKIVITAGPLVGREGLITHINRHNRNATIQVNMFGGRTEVKVALEIVDKK